MLRPMALRAAALLFLMLLQPVWAAAGALHHLCAGRASAADGCCCPSAERAPDAAVSEARPACCATVAVQQPAETVATRTADDEGPRWEVPRVTTLLLPLRRATPLVLAERQVARHARDRVGRQATAPPLFLRHCSFLI